MPRLARRTVPVAVALAALATLLAAPAALGASGGPAADPATQPGFRAAVVGGGKPHDAVEGTTWGTHARLIDTATDKRVGDASIACTVEKARDKRLIAHCIHSLTIDGRGTLLIEGTHHYRDVTVMPGTADPMRLMVIGGTGAYAHASGTADATEAPGGYVYRINAVL